MHAEIATLSRQGKREYNEDSHGQWQDGVRYVACVVADGAGGHGGGDVASALARDAVLSGFGSRPDLSPTTLHGLLQTVNSAIVYRQNEGDARLATMRTTLVLLALDLQERQAAWVHAGDSRLYHFRAGVCIEQSVDHSLVQQMVASGMLDMEAARQHPKRNLIYSALGTNDGTLEITAKPATTIDEGDVFLLCSDGVWEPVGDIGLAQHLHAASSPRDWLARLDAAVIAADKPAQDNYTAMALWLSADNDVTRMIEPV